MVEIITQETAEFRRYATREVVWCDFQNAANTFHPEFQGRHPAIVISSRNKSNRPLIVVPVTSMEQPDDDTCCFLLGKNYWKTTKKQSWAICSHLCSVSHLRLTRPFRYPKKLNQTDYRGVVTAASIRLSVLPDV